MFYLLMGFCVLLASWRWFQKPDPTQPPVWPGKLPLLGHGLMALGDSVKIFEYIKEMSIAGAKMDGWIRFYLGPRLLYCVCDPEDSLKVSTACNQKHYVYNFFRPFLNNGILNADAKFRPFIDLIMELAKDHPSLTDAQILGESNTIIGGGHDTTATALTFALTLLGSHPEVQEKAYKEILEVLGDSKVAIDKEDLSKLEYIEAIVKETIRLHPSIAIIARTLDKDIETKNFILKAGNSCVVSLYGVNRHPKLWGPDADEFRPERWFEKYTLPDSKYFASFGLGRRTCIGKTYAMISMKISLTHVLRRFTNTSDASKMVIKMDTMIRPVKGYHIALQNRH